ncbi:MAG: RraA family protein [Pseudomonadota bacterium]
MNIDTNTCERYKRIPVAVLNDVMVKAGCPDQVLSHEIKSSDGLPSFAGPAFCVRGERTAGGSGKPDVRFEMYRQFRSGSVLIIATGGYRSTAVLGENMTVALKMRGCQGIVVDGGYRDKSSIAEAGIPVRAMFVSPVASSGRFALVEFDVSVTLPGQSTPEVQIHAGDLVVGDEEGTIIIPARGVQTILEDAEKVIEAERRTRDLILAGEDAEKAYKSNDRFGHVRPI